MSTVISIKNFTCEIFYLSERTSRYYWLHCKNIVRIYIVFFFSFVGTRLLVNRAVVDKNERECSELNSIRTSLLILTLR